MSLLIAPLDALADVLSKSTGFQAFTGTANATAALGKIYPDFLPAPANNDEHTPAELQSYRPFAMIWQQESGGWKAQRVATNSCWKFGGALLIRIERAVNPAHTDQQASEEFKNLLSGILSSTDQTGLLQQDTILSLHQIEILMISRNPPETIPQFGDCYAAEVLLRWGLQ